MKYLLVIIVLICGLPASTLSQDCSQCSSVFDIAHMESARWPGYQKMKNIFQPGQEYDWLYARCFWNIDPAINYISGRVEHHITVLQLTDSVTFDFNEALTIHSVIFNGNETTFAFHTPLELTVYLPEVFSGPAVIEIDYEGIPEITSIYSFNQNFHAGVPEIWTLSEPFGARDWWPCKQVLNDKLDSVFIEVTVPSGNMAGAPGKLLNEIDNGDQTTTFVWSHKYPIPAYLVSLAVTNYVRFDQNVTVGEIDIPILNFVYPERLELEQERAIQTPILLKLFSELFGLYPYASEKYGHAQSSIPGGMEHSTMSTMSNLNFTLNAHELAHQWFGNKVTCGSWQDIWLNEGFATYLTGLAYENLSDINDWRSWREGTINSATSQPGGSVLVDDTLSRTRIFDGRLSYNKGAYLLHMLRYVLGDSTFFSACNNYLNDPDLAFSYARTHQLQAHLEALHGQSLEWFFQDWFYGEGFPSYSINWTPQSGGILLTVFQESSHPSVSFFEMPIQLSLIGNGTSRLVELNHEFSGQQFFIPNTFEVTAVQFDPDLWILSNGNQIAFVPDPVTDLYEVRIVPNPASDIIRISTLNPLFMANRIEIIDGKGAVVLEKQPADGIRSGYQIDISSLSKGFYLLRIVSEGFSKSIGFSKGY
jgi:aminopeptidase N